jgi:hypothetical protein
MGWHDVHIHAVAFRAELFEFWLNMDCIFSWVHPQRRGDVLPLFG